MLAAALLAALGCRDAQSPTAPEPAPALAATATALAFYQVTGGGSFSCGLTTANKGYCWGDGGALGDGTAISRLTPVAVQGGLQFRLLSAGVFHTCGVTTDYRAYCWGHSAYGEVGQQPYASDALSPAPVAGGRKFRQMDAGLWHTCGVTYPDNRAYCWGYNFYGQLGDGTSTTRQTPVAVLGGLQFRQVHVGDYHTCGVTPDDRAFCWGWNRYGQLGDSSTVNRRSKPFRVAGAHQFTQLDAGHLHTCAVTTDNRAYCWGNGREGEIGNGKQYLSFWPRRVAGGISFGRVSTGMFHSCGETLQNRVYCWGSNTDGQLGDGTIETERLTPVPVAGGLTFAQVSAGDFHTCGKTVAGVGYCWGMNFSGQIGDGTTTGRVIPTAVAGPR
jgi:alpha-tubulin suppressor-like RCC1 family protein